MSESIDKKSKATKKSSDTKVKKGSTSSKSKAKVSNLKTSNKKNNGVISSLKNEDSIVEKTIENESTFNDNVEVKEENILNEELIESNDDIKLIDEIIAEEKKDNKLSKIVVEKNFKTIDVIIIAIITLFVGLFIGSFFLKEKKKDTLVTTNNKYLDEFLSVVDTIKGNAYPEVSDEELFTSAIEGMLSGMGDVYSDYFDTTETNNFEIRMKGSYIGIGCEIATFVDLEGVVVVSVYDNTPASKAGLQSGDRILEVDGMDVLSWSSDQLSSYIRTNDVEGTKIKLRVDRNGEEVIIELTRELVVLDSVTGYTIDSGGKNIGYININLFASNTLEQFNKVLGDLEKTKIDSLIIDVRDNSGGYLGIATSIISKFIPANKIIYQLQDRTGVEKVYATSVEKRNYDIVVLVNEASASASEILASALKESYGATIIGRNTYGKGTVQETGKLSNGNLIKYTIQNWLTPSGKSIDGVGITPDVVVDDDSVMITKAVEILSNK